VAEERRRVDDACRRLDAQVQAALRRERSLLAALGSRPVLDAPVPALVAPRREHLQRERHAARTALERQVQTHRLHVDHSRAQVTALSPAATLARGYAVVQRDDGSVLRAAAEAEVGEPLRVRLAHGELSADVTSTRPPAGPSEAA
jgi:exodeoxyribonuclease VII large subunit